MTVVVSKAVRAALKAAGYGKADVSVHNDSYSMGSTVYVKIKRPEISLSKVESIAESFARVDRDSQTGEILGGGNCFVDVAYADGALDAAAARIAEQVAAGRTHFGPCELIVKDPFTYQVWHNLGDDDRDNVGRAGMHIDREKPGPGLARELAKIGQLDTLEQWGPVETPLTRDEQDAAERSMLIGASVHAAAANDALVQHCRDVADEMFDDSPFAVAHRDALDRARAADPHSPLPGFTAEPIFGLVDAAPHESAAVRGAIAALLAGIDAGTVPARQALEAVAHLAFAMGRARR